MPRVPHRQLLLNLLSEYQSSNRITSAEKLSISQLITFVDQYPDCFERSLAVGHVTGSAWIVDPARGRHRAGQLVQDAFLLTHHRKLGKWLQCGGHADGHPDVLAVALREAREESGIPDLTPISPLIFDVDVHSIPENPRESAHLHYDVRFALVAPAEAALVVSEESHALAWVQASQLGGYDTDDSVIRMARKWSSGRVGRPGDKPCAQPGSGARPLA